MTCNSTSQSRARRRPWVHCSGSRIVPQRLHGCLETQLSRLLLMRRRPAAHHQRADQIVGQQVRPISFSTIDGVSHRNTSICITLLIERRSSSMFQR